MRSGRVAVTRGSFWRSEPAAALRGLANGALPASTRLALSSAKAADGEEDLAADLDPLGTVASPASRCGMPSMVRTLWVTSSPVRPSPRVAARTSRPLLVEQVDRPGRRS